MYLKSLELYGFKSFPDRVKIDFGQGTTGIVGPNGSGKSNISDAIRWVLGEQSSKMLRSSKTEDVVFSGTEKRKPLGLAEVSLTFDNSAHFLKHDAEEVVITRRYYLSGESEYRINKKQVRLRDVRELFMDTGLGRDGYSIIGQGRIDEILSQKSEDRREIFEEAAGISKYRTRKEEAERKLAGASDNLTRLNDIVSELEVQIAPLEKKAAKAAAYLLIHDELRDLETDVWCERLEELKNNLTKSSGSLKICETMLSESRLALEKLYAESETLTEEIGESDRESEQLRQSLREWEGKLAEEDSAAAAAAATLEQLREQTARLERDLTLRADMSEALEKQLAEQNLEISELDGVIASSKARLEQLYGESERLAVDSSDENLRLEGIRAKESTIRMNITDAQNAIAAAETLCRELSTRSEEESGVSDAAKQELQAEIEQKNALTRRLKEQQETLDGLNNTMGGYRIILQRREETAKQLEEEKLRLTMEVGNLTSRRRMLTELQRDYEGYSKAVKQLMQMHARGAMPGICGTVGELVSVDNENALAIETALGAAMQNIITKTDEDSREAIEYLKRNDVGRATFWPINAIHGSVMQEAGLDDEPGFVGIAVDLCRFDPAYRNIFNSLLGRTAVFERLDSALRTARKRNHRFRIVTLDGQVINAGGSMTGGSVSRNTGILSRANEIHALEAKLTELAEQRRQNEAKSAEADRQLKAIRYQTEIGDGEKRAAEDKLLSLRLAAEQQDRTIAALEERIRSMSDSSDRTAERIAELRKQMEEKRADIARFESSAEEYHRSAEALVGTLSQQEQKRNDLTERITDQRVKLASQETHQISLRTAADNIMRQIRAAASDKQTVREELDGIAARISEILSDSGRRTLVREDCRTRVEATESEIAAVIGRRNEKEARKTVVDTGARATSDRVIELERELTRLQNAVQDSEQEQTRIATQMWENYEMTPGEAAARAKPVENKTQTARRITELRSKKRSLGDVDTGAIDELNIVRERYAYLTAQQADLQKSSQELTGLIEEITGEMTAIFEKTFDEINESFGVVFREIFGGGRAELSLADRSDVLNCGIEIHVQPPGKSLKFLSLLSGGEKALVAIALYFSILRIRPSPFCILDEIDAALDEQNVARFAAYLGAFSEGTQFIVITHRRGTMETTDRIYGITMQEQGISKVIPLDMSEVEKRFIKSGT